MKIGNMGKCLVSETHTRPRTIEKNQSENWSDGTAPRPPVQHVLGAAGQPLDAVLVQGDQVCGAPCDGPNAATRPAPVFFGDPGKKRPPTQDPRYTKMEESIQKIMLEITTIS